MTRLDDDDLDSILLALGHFPTWFPETAAKVSALRPHLKDARDGFDRDTLADVLTEAHLRRDGHCGDTHLPEADFVIERYKTRRSETRQGAE